MRMKKWLFLSFLFSVCLTSTAQTDEALWNITYQAKCKMFETDKSLSQEMQCLAIGKHSSRYYSLHLEWYKKNGSGVCPYKGTLMQFEVYKNMPKAGTMTFIHMPFWVTVEDRMEGLFDWVPAEGDTVICNYPCKKATTKFRGRTWTAWYALDLPFNDGPWKLHGLPGLILSAHDADGLFRFTCLGVKKGHGELFEYPQYNGKVFVTPERAEELMTMEYMDDAAYLHMMDGGTMVKRMKNGKEYKFVPKKACLFETFAKPKKDKKKRKKRK